MAGLSWTKKHVASMVEVLEQDHETMADAASAALDAALAIIEERAKFAIVGQVRSTIEHGDVDPCHPAAVKVALGFFESDTKANEAAAQLTANTAGDRLRTWVVPAFFGTPAAWHKERRDYYADLESKADEKRKAKLKESIEKRHLEAEARAQEIRDREAAAGGQMWPCPTTRIKRKECRHVPPCG